MDATSLWVVSQQKKALVLHAALALVIFIAGWLIGRGMSPYYAAHPIVFEEQQCVGPIAGGAEQLAALREQGSSARAADVSASPQATVAAAQTTSPAVQDPGTPTQAQSDKQFVASVNSDLYHHASCSTVSRIKAENKVWFSSAAAATEAGYKPSKCAAEYNESHKDN